MADNDFSDIEGALTGATTSVGAPAVASVASSGASALPAAYYSPQAMVELMLACPDYTPLQLAQHFGRTESWLTQVLASNAFQAALEPVRHLIADPYLTASMDERFRALAMRSAGVLQKKLDNPAVPDMVVLKAAELGIKALGLGAPQPAPVAAPAVGPEAVAAKLAEAMEKIQLRRGAASAVDAEIVQEPPQS